MQLPAIYFMRWLMLAICLALPSLAFANDNSAGSYYVVNVWGPEEGLTGDSVSDVVQTPEGYIWIGTMFGDVLRFDGVHFVRYDFANTPELSRGGGVSRLMVAQNGTLWITMSDGRLTTWDHEGFHSVFTSKSSPPACTLWSAPDKIIFACDDGKLLAGQKRPRQWDWQTVTLPHISLQNQECADVQGRVWYLQSNNEIGIWNDGKTKTLALTAALAGQVIKVLRSDAEGRIWIGTDQALAMWQTNHFVLMTPTNGEAGLNVQRIVVSGDSLWVEANGHMRRCAERQWLAESYGWAHALGGEPSLNFLQADREGGLWAGAGSQGLIHIAANGMFQRITTQDGLPSNTVPFAYEDHDGNVWTGYVRGGLVQIRQRLFSVISMNDGLEDSLINTVCEDAQGAVWIGTHSGIVSRYQNGLCSNVVLPGPAHAQNSCVAADTHGRVWIGAEGVGLLLSQAGELRLIATESQLQSYPRLLLPERDGRLWLGTLRSIICVSNENLTFEYTSQSKSGCPTALTETADGTIWAGTQRGLLLRWNGYQFITIQPPDYSSLGRIWAFWPATDGSLWAATEKGGLLRRINGKFYRYTTKNGLPSDNIMQLLGDTHGNLWLGTADGIARVSTAALARSEDAVLAAKELSVYERADGLLTTACANTMDQPNCWRGLDGTLFFTMENSIAAIRPNDVYINPEAPTAVIEEMWDNGKRVWPSSAGAIVTLRETPENDKITLPEIKVGPGRSDLEFDYTGLNTGSPKCVRFKYRLEGLESKWNNVGTERKAIYRNVPPGHHVFSVTACNSDTVWSTNSVLLAVQVNPFFYQTIWFQATTASLAFIGLLLVGNIIMRQRMRRRVEQLERQHELERVRSRIARDLHDELGTGLTEIGLLGELASDPAVSPNDKEHYLDQLKESAHSIVAGLDEIVWAVNPRYDSVNSLVSYYSLFAQRFLNLGGINCHLQVLEPIPEYPLDSKFRHEMFLAFKEALNNIVRHSKAEEVEIKIKVVENQLTISVSDNGCGIERRSGPGQDGLVGMQERLQQIGGECQISSQPGGGTKVIFQILLNKICS